MCEWPGQTKNTEELDDGFEVNFSGVLVDGGALRAAVGEEPINTHQNADAA